MRVLLDAYWWDGGPPSGKAVVRALIDTWVDMYPDDELGAIVPLGGEPKLPDSVRAFATRLAPHGVAMAFGVRAACRQFLPDAVLTQNFAPIATSGVPSIVFVHDVIFRREPRWFTLGERAYLAPIIPLARGASVVVTSSHAEASEIRRLLPAHSTVEAVGLAAPTTLTHARARRPNCLPTQVDDFVLSVGRLNVRKNLETALSAAAHSGSISPATPLVVVGEADGVAAKLSPGTQAAVDAGQIIFAGPVTDAELSWLYARARALVFVSLDEGFGLPPVEAAFFGCPAIVSDIPVLRETAPDSSVFVAPRDVHGIAVAIDAAASRKAGLLHVGAETRHTWPSVVSRLRVLCNEVAR